MLCRFVFFLFIFLNRADDHRLGGFFFLFFSDN